MRINKTHVATATTLLLLSLPSLGADPQWEAFEDRMRETAGTVSFTQYAWPYQWVCCLVIAVVLFRYREKLPEWWRYREWLSTVIVTIVVYWAAVISYLAISGRIRDMERMEVLHDTLYVGFGGLMCWFLVYLVRRVMGSD